jgi:hypothetical protein
LGEVTDVSPSIDNALDWHSRSCGHYVCNCDVYRTLIWSSLGLGVGPQFYFCFLFRAFWQSQSAHSSFHLNNEKNAALALWILSAIDAFLWPTLSGHLTLGNLYPIGIGIAGGGIAYFLVRSGLLSGRGINRVSAQNPQKGPV